MDISASCVVARVRYLLVNIRDVSIRVLHLDQPFLSVLTFGSKLVSERPGSSHVKGDLQQSKKYHIEIETNSVHVQ